jgi:hypothetical protein
VKGKKMKQLRTSFRLPVLAVLAAAFLLAQHALAEDEFGREVRESGCPSDSVQLQNAATAAVSLENRFFRALSHTRFASSHT